MWLSWRDALNSQASGLVSSQSGKQFVIATVKELALPTFKLAEQPKNDTTNLFFYADVAQLVEQCIRNA